MIINIAVCDDEQESLKMIQNELYKAAVNLNITIEIYSYNSGDTVANLICNNKEHFDILYLDIDMPGMSGLNVAKKIRNVNSDIILIFISAHEQYVFESIEYNPYRYIRKSKMCHEIENSLKAAYNKIISENSGSMVLKIEDGEIRVKYSDIMYFEMNSRRVSIFTNDGQERKLVGRKTIKELYSELDSEEFIQIHSGCIVNAKYINEYSSHDITLDNGTKLIVSRGKIKTVKQTVMRYWRGKL